MNGTTAGSRILIVEDEQHIADGLRFNLEAEGHDAIVVADGERAVQLLTDERQRFKELERENRELKRANEILQTASAYFAKAALDRRPK